MSGPATPDGQGRLLGIARRPASGAPVETTERAAITLSRGVAGDCKGATRAGKPSKRQVTLLDAAGWQAALAEIGADIDWHHRRANLYVGDIRLPRTPGTRIAVGAEVVLEVTAECNPCFKMEALRPGLEAALTPDWRGGVCTKVLIEGEISVGDTIRIEA